MYEILTNLLPELSDSKAVGEWIADHKNDGTKEHTIQFPFVAYAEAVTKLEDNIYTFEKEHPELSLNKYQAILEEQGIKYCEGYYNNWKNRGSSDRVFYWKRMYWMQTVFLCMSAKMH